MAKPTIKQLTAALRSARRIIQDDRDDQFASSCVPHRDGSPRVETFDEEDRPFIDRYDRLLRKIDKALSAGHRPTDPHSPDSQRGWE